MKLLLFIFLFRFLFCGVADILRKEPSYIAAFQCKADKNDKAIREIL